jgi:hypothetical protein
MIEEGIQEKRNAIIGQPIQNYTMSELYDHKLYNASINIIVSNILYRVGVLRRVGRCKRAANEL